MTGVLAVLVASAGTGYAAGLTKGSVKSVHIADGNVRTVDLDDDAVTSAQVRSGSLKADDVKDGSLAEPGFSGYDVWTSDDQGGTTSFFLSAGATDDVVVSCPVGKKAISGGLAFTGFDVVQLRSMPVEDGSGWVTRLRNNGSSTAVGGISIVCVEVAG